MGEQSLRTREAHALLGVCAVFLRLGCISFGGPIAHLGYFRDEFVARRGWITDDAYADLVALCQFLPGPASSQVVFAIGMRRAGILGAMAASICFMAPSVAIMLAFAYSVSGAPAITSAGWVHGLKLAAVSVVAYAVWSMGRALCTDAVRIAVCVGAAALTLAVPGVLTQAGAIGGGAIIGWAVYRSAPLAPPEAPPPTPRGHAAAIGALAAYVGLLAILPSVAIGTGSHAVAVFDSFYRSGALVFGGGHVVLPLLRAEVVPPGWITDDAFLAGYGAAQALPGPLFTLAAYLGAVMHGGPNAWIGGLWCLLAIFLPAWLVIAGALPFWHWMRTRPWAYASMRGANGAVVGILLGALYTPVATESIRSAWDLGAASAGFAALLLWKAPPWAIVIFMAAAGQWLLP